ncbi:phosphoribosylglycinamide formyltransferase [Bartonella sp. HY038]|uniref:phosphoribosylglycinamide formyltransferase n=1 Tax=Bartonella sp. HY038 TaxID=2759660 RepID=UPI0015F8364B|nr:phosphoribosylglycinamide formyltransferase [Bartonella sp. HY038]
MSRKRVVVFISGGGSNMEKLIEASKAADYPAEIIAVFSDKANAGGLDKAKLQGVETFVFERASFVSKQAHEDAILQQLDALAPDIICLAGYMRIISGSFIKPYEGKILNIHPSLLPLFPGLHTHQRAIDAGVKIAGCTVHIVTEGMDEGPILAQAVVPVLASDNADSLSARVLKQEHRLYPQTLRNFIDKKCIITSDQQSLISFG